MFSVVFSRVVKPVTSQNTLFILLIVFMKLIRKFKLIYNFFYCTSQKLFSRGSIKTKTFESAIKYNYLIKNIANLVCSVMLDMLNPKAQAEPQRMFQHVKMVCRVSG